MCQEQLDKQRLHLFGWEVKGDEATHKERFKEALGIVGKLAEAFPHHAASIPNVNHFFHACWTEDVSAPGYDKSAWLGLQRKLNLLGVTV